MRTRARARRLQVMQEAERAAAHLDVGDAALAAFRRRCSGCRARCRAARSSASVRVANAGMPYFRAERSAAHLHVHETGCRVRRFTCGSISIVCPGTRVSANRRASMIDMRVHFDQGEMLADARARAEPERKVDEAIARPALASGRNRSGIEGVGLAPSMPGCRWTR